MKPAAAAALASAFSDFCHIWGFWRVVRYDIQGGCHSTIVMTAESFNKKIRIRKEDRQSINVKDETSSPKARNQL
jgi:hypothetical protein